MPKLDPSAVDPSEIEKAVVALAKYVGAQGGGGASKLLDEEDDELIYLLIALRKTPKESRKDKPVRIPLPHSLWNSAEPEVCLIVKDKEGEGHKAAKQRLAEEKKSGVKKVIGISKLKSKYEPHEAKRALCNDFDVFMADDRVLPMLPKLIGKSFFKKKKQPVPVDLTTKDWAGQVQKALNSTYMFRGGGSCITIKVAKTSHSTEEAVQNVSAVLKQAMQKLPKGWDNLQAAYLKTSNSVALPIVQHLPEDVAGTKIDSKGNAIQLKVQKAAKA